MYSCPRIIGKDQSVVYLVAILLGNEGSSDHLRQEDEKFYQCYALQLLTLEYDQYVYFSIQLVCD